MVRDLWLREKAVFRPNYVNFRAPKAAHVGAPTIPLTPLGKPRSLPITTKKPVILSSLSVFD